MTPTDPAPALAARLVSALNADPEVTGAVGRVFRDAVPSGTDRPHAVVIAEPTELTYLNPCLVQGQAELRVEARLSGDNGEATRRVVARVIGAAAGLRAATLDGVRVGGFVVSESDVAPDDTPNAWVGTVLLSATTYASPRSS